MITHLSLLAQMSASHDAEIASHLHDMLSLDKTSPTPTPRTVG